MRSTAQLKMRCYVIDSRIYTDITCGKYRREEAMYQIRSVSVACVSLAIILTAGQVPAPGQSSTVPQSQTQAPTSEKEKRQESSAAPEQPKPILATKIVPNSRVFIASMQGNLDGFVSAEMVKKKLPVTITTDEDTADYVLTGTSIKADDKWYHTVFGGKDKNEGNVTLIRVKDKTVIWAGEAGDRSMWWGGWSRGGQRKVADRIVSKLKKDLF